MKIFKEYILLYGIKDTVLRGHVLQLVLDQSDYPIMLADKLF